jgi:hypothetical protein
MISPSGAPHKPTACPKNRVQYSQKSDRPRNPYCEACCQRLSHRSDSQPETIVPTRGGRSKQRRNGEGLDWSRGRGPRRHSESRVMLGAKPGRRFPTGLPALFEDTGPNDECVGQRLQRGTTGLPPVFRKIWSKREAERSEDATQSVRGILWGPVAQRVRV